MTHTNEPNGNNPKGWTYSRGENAKLRIYHPSGKRAKPQEIIDALNALDRLKAEGSETRIIDVAAIRERINSIANSREDGAVRRASGMSEMLNELLPFIYQPQPGNETAEKLREHISHCESDHASIDELLSQFNRVGIETFNWDGDEGAEAAIVDGVVNHISQLQGEKQKEIERLIADRNLEKKWRKDAEGKAVDLESLLSNAGKEVSDEMIDDWALNYAMNVDNQDTQRTAKYFAKLVRDTHYAPRVAALEAKVKELTECLLRTDSESKTGYSENKVE